MELYAENILEHYRHPRNKQPVTNATVEHREENASCGDDLTISLVVRDGAIEQIGWAGQGCAISQAAMSILSEELVGKKVKDIAILTPKDIYDLLGVPVGPRRFKCALLCLHTLRNALNKAMGKPIQTWLETVEIAES